MAGHGREDLVGVVVGADGDRLALGQLAGLGLLRVPSLAQHLDGDVAVGQDALELVVGAADRQSAHAELGELAGGVQDAVLGADALRGGGHDVACHRHDSVAFLQEVWGGVTGRGR